MFSGHVRRTIVSVWTKETEKVISPSWCVCSSSPPRLFLSLCAALTERPFYEEWWFLLVMALVGLILILVLVFTLLLHGHSTKYKACSTGVWLRLSNVTLYRVTQWCHSYNCVATSRLSYTKDNCLFACVCCFFFMSVTLTLFLSVSTDSPHVQSTLNKVKSWDMHQFSCTVWGAKLPVAVVFLQPHCHLWGLMREENKVSLVPLGKTASWSISGKKISLKPHCRFFNIASD